MNGFASVYLAIQPFCNANPVGLSGAGHACCRGSKTTRGKNYKNLFRTLPNIKKWDPRGKSSFFTSEIVLCDLPLEMKSKLVFGQNLYLPPPVTD